MSIRVGHILRHEDDSGVSGTGRVAEWVEYSDGEVVGHWLSHTPSTNHYRNMKQVDAIHGHGGKTEIVVDWEEPKPAPQEDETEAEETETSLEDLEEEVVEDDSEELETADPEKTTRKPGPKGKDKK